MHSIMFVCHGNICRSPMAELIFRDMVECKGLRDEFLIASSATSTEEIYRGRGNPIYPPAREMLIKHKIPFCEHYATLFAPSDYLSYDLIVVMDSRNFAGVLRICSGDPESKVRRLLDFTGEDRDVSDPWYSGDFEKAFSDIQRGCAALLDYLTK